MTKVYLAARFRNKPLLQDIREIMKERGYEVTSRWLDGDPKSVVDNAVMDLEDVARADALLLYIDEPEPGQGPMRGAWVEFGCAYALHKLCILIHPELAMSIFVHLPEAKWARSWAEAMDVLSGKSEGSRAALAEQVH